MELIVDTNIFISAVIAKSITLDLIFDERLKLFSTEYSFTEIKKHLNEISKKSKLNKKELEFLFSKLFSKTQIFSQEEYNYLKEKAKIISPDKNDWPFIALAMHLNCPVWTNDLKLKKQKKAKIITTKELLEKLKVR